MHYVIVGSSAAGTAAARSIRKSDSSGKITILTEDDAFFSRCQLHLLASGRRSHQQANFLPVEWATKESIDIQWNKKVASVNPDTHTVSTADGDNISYDRLLIATGSRSWTPPIDGIDGELSFSLRTLDDADRILAVLPFVKSISIIGAGLVGTELAAELAKAGKVVNIIELADHPLPMQLEESTGARCALLMQEAGIKLFCGRKVVSVRRKENDSPEAVVLDDGQSIECDMIVSAAGVRPNIEWLADSGIATEPKGILINEFGQTNINDIFAAGDVTIMEDVLLRSVMPSPIWPTAIHQGRIAGKNMAGGNESLTHNTGFRSSVRLLDTNIVSIGPVNNPDPSWEKQEVLYTNSRGESCLKLLYLDDNKLRAVILWGEITDAGVYADAIINNRTLPELDFVGSLDGAKFGQEERNIM